MNTRVSIRGEAVILIEGSVFMDSGPGLSGRPGMTIPAYFSARILALTSGPAAPSTLASAAVNSALGQAGPAASS